MSYIPLSDTFPLTTIWSSEEKCMAKAKIINSLDTTSQIKMVNILKSFLSRRGFHAKTINFKKGRESYEPTPTQITLKQNNIIYL